MRALSRVPCAVRSPPLRALRTAGANRRFASLARRPPMEEHFDIVDPVSGQPTGEVRPRSQVHAQGLYHRAVHVWLWAPSRGELLLQRRAACKDVRAGGRRRCIRGGCEAVALRELDVLSPGSP
jgi:hypothetical protein